MSVRGNEGSTGSRSAAEVAPSTASVPLHPMRRSIRVRWHTAVLLTSLDPKVEFHERCETLVVNLHGCALRTGSTLPRGTPVQLQVSGNVIIGRVVDVVSIADHESCWMLGIALDLPGNFWGIPNPPKEWDAMAQPAPREASPGTSDEQSQKSSTAEKFTIWPSAFGPAAQGTSTPSPREPRTPSRDSQEDGFRATVPTVGKIDSGQSQSESSRAIEAGLVHLQSEIEQRAAAEWMRLRSQAEQIVQGAGTQLRSELEQGLIAWREERAGVEGKVQELLRLREQIEVRLNTGADLLRGEVPLREQMIDQARQELRALIRDFQEKAAADSTAREAISAQVAQTLQARADEESLFQQHRIEQQAAQQAISDEVARSRQVRELVESLVRSLPDTIETQVQERAQAMLAQLRDDLGRDLSAQARSDLDGLDKRLQRIVGEATQELRPILSQEFERQQKHLLDATAARLAELREVEASLRDSARESAASVAVESERALAQMREQLQYVFADHQERIEQGNKDAASALQAVAGNLLTSMRHALLEDLGREQEQVRQLVQTKIEEQLRDAPQTAEAALQERAKPMLDSLHQELLKTFEQRQQSFETAHAAATAQLRQLEKRTDELAARVDVELQAHTEKTIHAAVAQITEQLQQAAAGVREAHLTTAQAELDRTLGPLVSQAGEAAADLRLSFESLQQHTTAGEAASAQLHQEVQDAAAHLVELRELEASLRNSARESAASVAVESERALAQMREQLQDVFAEQQERVEQGNKDAVIALQAVAGNLLTSMRHGLLNDLGREQEQVRQLVQTKIEEQLRDAQQTAQAALQERAKQVLDSLHRELLNTFEDRQQSFETAHAAATAQLRQLEKRTDELAARVDVELQAHTEKTITRRSRKSPNSCSGPRRAFERLT